MCVQAQHKTAPKGSHPAPGDGGRPSPAPLPFCCPQEVMPRWDLCSKVISSRRQSQRQTPHRAGLEQHPGSNKLSSFEWWMQIKGNSTSFLIGLQYCFPLWLLQKKKNLKNPIVCAILMFNIY